MPSYEIIVLPLAESDIANNTNYIFYEKKAPDTALNLLDGFKKSIADLSFMPERHEFDEDEELAKLQIRKCYYKNYKIFFYVNKETRKVFVLRVLHMLVDAKALLLNVRF